jgi:hypothetical protein
MMPLYAGTGMEIAPPFILKSEARRLGVSGAALGKVAFHFEQLGVENTAACRAPYRIVGEAHKA